MSSDTVLILKEVMILGYSIPKTNWNKISTFIPCWLRLYPYVNQRHKNAQNVLYTHMLLCQIRYMPRCADLQLNPILLKIMQNKNSNCHLFIASLKHLFPSSNNLNSNCICAFKLNCNGIYFFFRNSSSPTRYFSFDEFSLFQIQTTTTTKHKETKKQTKPFKSQ